MEQVACSINETAKALGCGRTTTYQLIRDKRLEIIKIGRRTLVLTESIRMLAKAE